MPNNFTELERKAYMIWWRQKCKIGVRYSQKDFIAWYVKEHRRKKLKRPEVGRRDHSKPYSFDNIDLIERTDNLKERNARCGNPGRTHRAVVAYDLCGNKLGDFESKTAAAKHFGLCDKTVYNHRQGRTALHMKYGRPKGAQKVRFEWAK